MEFTVSADHRVKMKGCEKIKIQRPCQRTEKAVEHEGQGNTNSSRCARNCPQELEELEISGRIGTIQTTAFLRSTRILRRVLDT